MTHTIYEIVPEDVLLFRDARPFSAGDDHHAHSQFPPPPSVLYGALRTAGIALHTDLATFADLDRQGDWRKVYGTPQHPGSLSQRGPLLFCGEKVLFPAPADVLKAKDPPKDPPDSPRWTRMAPPREVVAVQGSVDPRLSPLWSRASGIWEEAKEFFDRGEIETYLLGRVPERGAGAPPGLTRLEPRSGIRLGRDSRTVEEGHLYTADFVRIADPDDPLAAAGFLTVIEGDEAAELPKEGWLRLGGESRPARYQRRDETSDPWPEGHVEEGRRFTWYLLTPALFRNGWRPAAIRAEGDSYVLEQGPVRARLAGAALGRAPRIGGWNLATNLPRPLRRAVAAGSVYFFELLEGTPDDVLSLFHGKNLSDDRAVEGFGLTLVGGWNHV
ncbi:MAG: type III-B CRISPR module-associated protein Cmr3 [Planctomycetes bacterium]|nr:type III-B CRISPR module-associated protein Cmr3 [Planctomycetota bacterium]